MPSRWTTYANERLAGEGYRRGGGRAAVIDFLDGQDCALSAQEIEDALRDGERRVGRCGKLIPFVDDELERAIRKVSRREGFALEAHEITLHGYCADCSPAQ